MGKLERDTIELFCKSVISEQKAIMSARKMDATGESRRLLEYEIRGNKGIILGPEHIVQMEEGRGPGKWPPLKDIEKWVIAKGIATGKAAKQMAFLVARKIGEEGTVLHRMRQKSGIISKTLNRQRIDTFFRSEYVPKKQLQITNKLGKALEI